MKEFTDITLLIDESSSMQVIRAATIEGINAFILEQQKSELPSVLTLATFSEPLVQARYGRPRKYFDPCNYLYESRPVKRVSLLKDKDYEPIGHSTALYDAMGHLIDTVGERLSEAPADERPNKVIIVTMTDGEENSSQHYNQTSVRQKVEHQRGKYSWEFLYLGANQDAFKVGGGLGVPVHQCMNYDHTSKGTRNALIGTQCAVSSYQRGGPAAFVQR